MSQTDLGSVGGYGGFGSYGHGDDGDRNWFAASLASLLIYGGIAVAVVLLGTATKRVMLDEKKVDVTFVEKVVKEPPPPPPPAPVVEPPKPVEPVAPAAAAPVVRPDMKVRKLDKPPPPKKLTAPKEMPTAPAKEVDPSLDKGVAVVGEGGAGDPAGLEGGVTQGGVAGGMVGGVIALPENAVPPKPLRSNPVPQYPQQARAAGRTATVILKVVVLADGTVADVQVMRGEEPFSSEAVKTVRRWRYEPAMYKGQPITVYRVVRIPFKLRA